jgi:hypothetical protein
MAMAGRAPGESMLQSSDGHKKAGGMGMPPAGSHTHKEPVYQARTSITLRV